MKKMKCFRMYGLRHWRAGMTNLLDARIKAKKEQLINKLKDKNITSDDEGKRLEELSLLELAILAGEIKKRDEE